MAGRVVAPFGTWTSPISARVVATQGVRLGFVCVDGDDIYWLEGRPGEGGRNVVVRRTPDGHLSDVTPRGTNVRTRVHEYGGGAYVAASGSLYYSNFADQRVYRVAGPEAAPEPLTPEGSWFYADYALDARRRRLICVREDHTEKGREPVNTIVSIPIDGRACGLHAVSVLTSGYDFYSTPRLSPDGRQLAWICWRHPNMPWDGTELRVADVTAEGALANERSVAGGPDESIYQPGWSPDGRLHFASDRNGWWRLYRSRDLRPLDPEPRDLRDPFEAAIAHVPDDAEFGRPNWQFGSATWVFAGSSLLVCYVRRGRWYLGRVGADDSLREIATDVEPADWLAATRTHLVFAGGSPAMPQGVVRLEIARLSERDPLAGIAPEGSSVLSPVELLRSSASLPADRASLSEPEAIEFETEGGLTAHAFYYAPRSQAFEAPAGELPPLIVVSHGGPTTATRSTLDLQVQFWTSRGFAVADVNYGGSSGYGRLYRERLKGQWGVVDVADCINAARYLVAQQRADPRRLIIRGGSAGGYTTLAALTFHPDVFHAGASYYGVSDIEMLARDTHKFESRYLDSLIGPYPEARDVYVARSPIHVVNRLSCALILFQGLEDTIVPPNQSQMMADAVRAKGLPVALLTFEGEQHGFRKAETIVRCLEAELSFYGIVFGFASADPIEPVIVDNPPRPGVVP